MNKRRISKYVVLSSNFCDVEFAKNRDDAVALSKEILKDSEETVFAYIAKIEKVMKLHVEVTDVQG